MPGNLGRPLSEVLSVAFMIVGGALGVFFAVGFSLLPRLLIIALGAGLGLVIGRAVGKMIERRR